MKRILLLLSLLLCGVTYVVAQNYKVKIYRERFDDGDQYVDVSYAERATPLQNKWKVEGVANTSLTECKFWLRHFNRSEGTEDKHCLLYFLFFSIDREAVEPLNSVELLLSNGERLKLDTHAIDNVPYLAFYLKPYHVFLEEPQYTSTFRTWPTFNSNNPSGALSDFWRNLELETSRHLFNQLALYDIKQMTIYKKVGYKLEKVNLYPPFRSSELFKPLIAKLRSSLTDKSSLPDINNLDRSWARKNINVKIVPSRGYGYEAHWENYISTVTSNNIDFKFPLFHDIENNRAIIDFFSIGYQLLDRMSYVGKDSPMTIKLSNGVEFATKKAACQPTLTSRRVNFRAALDEFADTRNPSVMVAPKTMLQQLAKYDVVEVKFLNHTIDLRNVDSSTAELFGKMCKALLEKTGAAELYSLTTPVSAVRQTTSSKATQPATKPATKPIQTATKSAETNKPTATQKAEPTGFLSAAQNKLKYGRHIARYDHIAPSQLMHSPLALFTSRAIPMDDLVSIVDGAKGVGKVTVSTSSDGKQKSATVHPTEFYCRLRGFEEVPCSLMSVGYEADNQQQIKTATFTYDLPSSWKRGKVKEYAEAFSNDMHRIGMQWTEEKDRYVGTYNGHYIMISYGGKGDDNFIYVYICYADEK